MADNPERDRQDPYPADQQFGAAAAEDQEKVDRGEVDASSDQPARDARPGNKA